VTTNARANTSKLEKATECLLRSIGSVVSVRLGTNPVIRWSIINDLKDCVECLKVAAELSRECRIYDRRECRLMADCRPTRTAVVDPLAPIALADVHFAANMCRSRLQRDEYTAQNLRRIA
jgi:hypothetical protein